MGYRFLTCLLALSALPVSAQEQCPAPVYSGDWDGRQVGQTDLSILGANFATYFSVGSEASATATIDASACDGTFFLHLPEQSFEMRAVGVAESGWPEYEGRIVNQFNGGEMRWVMRLQPTDVDRMIGTYDMKTTLSVPGRATGGTGVLFNYPGGDRRPECECRAQLEDFIKESIAEADRFIAVFSNTVYQQRPNGMPEAGATIDPWNTESYGRLTDLIMSGYSYDVAARRIVENTDQYGKAIEPDLATLEPPNDTSGEPTMVVVAAETGPDCNTEHGTLYRTTCFPQIAFDSTETHEARHRLACDLAQRDSPAQLRPDRPPNTTERTRIPIHAAEEVAAYEAEIEFLENWIPEHCDG